MTGKRLWKRLAAIVVVALLAVGMAVPLSAADAVPQKVLDARSGVVRIVCIVPEGFAVGTGFIVGTEEDWYVVTNHHVIDLSEHTAATPEIRVYYDTGKYVAADIFQDEPDRDIVLLKISGRLKDVTILPLRVEPVTTGISCYALGFPGAADQLSGDWDKYIEGSEDFVADIDSQTVTNGIVSGVRDNANVGNASRNVKIVQNNVAISGGNSGGPLLDDEGCVIGINTMGMLDVQGVNAAVYVQELIAILKSARITFEEPPEPIVGSSSAPVVEESGGMGAWVIVLVAIVVLAGGAAALILVLRNKKKSPVKGGRTLAEFERGYSRLEEVPAMDMMRRFVAELLPIAGYDLNPLMSPDNLVIGDDAIALKEKTSQLPAGAKAPVYPGYSAPECYRGVPGPAATVYFLGGVLYTMLTGQRPGEAMVRQQKNEPVFPSPNHLQNLVNRAMEPYEQNRIRDLYQFNDELAAVAQAVYAENGYPTQQDGYWPQQ